MPAPLPQPSWSEQPRAEPEPAVIELMSKHREATGDPCTSELASLALASSNLLRAAGAVAATAPTVIGEIPATIVFIGSAIAVGVTAAQYLNCRDEHATAAKP